MWEAVRGSRRGGSRKIQFGSYFYTSAVSVLRWRKVSIKQKLQKVNLNPVKCVKIFSEISYLLFIFTCSFLWENSWESQRVLKYKSLLSRIGIFCHKCYGLLHRIAAMALGHRYILSHASIVKIQEKKSSMWSTWFAHGRNVLLGHFRREKRLDNQDKLHNTAIKPGSLGNVNIH